MTESTAIVKSEGKVANAKKPMIVYLFDSKYSVDTSMVDEVVDCFDYQCFGVLACRSCGCKTNIKECEGGESKENGVNRLGHKVPIAVKIGEREKRMWGKGGGCVDRSDDENVYNYLSGM